VGGEGLRKLPHEVKTLRIREEKMQHATAWMWYESIRYLGDFTVSTKLCTMLYSFEVAVHHTTLISVRTTEGLCPWRSG
jgi:hypothetical protein